MAKQNRIVFNIILIANRIILCLFLLSGPRFVIAKVISGKVITVAEKAPLNNAKIGILGSDLITFTDDSGVYRLLLNSNMQKFQISATCPYYESIIDTLNFSNGQEKIEKNIELKRYAQKELYEDPSLKVEGKVLNHKKKIPLDDVNIWAVGTKGNALSDAKGGFLFDVDGIDSNLKEARLFFYKAGYGSIQRKPIKLNTKEKKHVKNIRLVKLNRIENPSCNLIISCKPDLQDLIKKSVLLKI